MRTPATPYAGWTRNQGYPKFSRAGGALTATDRFYVDYDDFDPDQLEALELLDFMGLIVSGSSAEPDEASHKMFIIVTYSRPSSGGGSSAVEGVPQFTLDDSGTEIPIDKCKNDGSLWFPAYKTCHNYKLAAKAGEDTDPAWWATATDTKIDGGENYRWVKDAGELPGADWTIIKEKKKRIESVVAPAPVVVENTWFGNYNQAIANRKTVGARVTPERTFGVTGQWLVMGSNVAPDGRRWVCVTRYQAAPEWDADYYAAGS
jgi:hypothetical protein